MENLKDDETLQVLWLYREDKGVIKTADFNKELETTKEKREEAYAKLMAELTVNITDKQKLKLIVEVLSNYSDKCNIEQSIYYEQYYKTGVKDIVRFILQCLM